jgi:hypothetical protein
MHFAADHEVGVGGEHRPAASQLDAKPQSRASVAFQPGLDADLPSGEVRGECDAADAGPRHLFDPDALPDPGGARIPDRVRLQLPILLAARLREVVRIVFGANDDHAAGRWRERGDVEGERRVTAVVRSGVHAIHPYGCPVVHRPEMEQPLLIRRAGR